MPLSKTDVFRRLALVSHAPRLGTQRKITMADLLAIDQVPAFITEAYRHFLGREPDPEGFETHTAFLESGGDRLAFLQHLRTSEEGRKNASEDLSGWASRSAAELLAVTPDDDFIIAAYRNYLWRDPDQPGLAHYRAALMDGKPKAFVLRALSASEEAKRLGTPGLKDSDSFEQVLALPPRELITAAYRMLLWRDPDEDGLRFFEQHMDRGVPGAWVLWRIESSAEAVAIGATIVPEEWRPKTFEALLAISADAEFLTAAYRTYLWRNPDGPGLEAFTGLLQQGAPRPNVLYRIGASEEARRVEGGFPEDWLPKSIEELLRIPEQDFIRAVYRTVLWRDPDAAAAGRYGTQLVCGRPRRGVIREIRGSAEASRLPFATPDAGRDGWLARLRDGWAWRLRMTLFGRVVEHTQRLDGKLSEAHAAAQQSAQRLSQELSGLERIVSAVGSVRQTQEHLVAEAGRHYALARQTSDQVAALPAEVRHQAAVLSEKLDERAMQQGRGIAELGKTASTLTQAVLVNRQILQDGLRVGGAPTQTAISLPDNLVVTRLEDFLYAIPGEDVRLAAYLTFRGHLEPGLHEFFRRWIQPGMHVIDAGANIGLHSLLLARKVGEEGRVYCFEPSPRVFRILNLNATMNTLTRRMNTFEMALADAPGSARFFVHDTCGHSSLYSDGVEHRTTEVKTDSLDNLIPAGRRIDVVKIDVEGAEPLVLRGLSRILFANPEIVVILEFAPSLLRRGGFDPSEFLSEILSLGFTLRKVDDLSGDLLPVEPKALLASRSVNLHLTRQPAGAGAAS